MVLQYIFNIGCFSSKQAPAVQTWQRSLFLVDIHQLAQENRCYRRSLRENCLIKSRPDIGHALHELYFWRKIVM